MNDLNLCQFIGRVGQTPEIKYMPSGKAVANFSIACNRSWKDQQGQKQEKAEWVRCTAYDKLAEIIGQYADKGSQLYVSGRQATRKWTDNNGQDKYTTEIIVDQMQMLGGNSGQNSGQSSGYNKNQQSNNSYQQGNNSYQQSSQQQSQQPQGNTPPMGEPDFGDDLDIPF